MLEPTNRSISMLAAWFRVAYAAAFLMALNSLWGVVQLVSVGGLEATQLQTQTMISLRAFQSGWDLALVVFGCHLLALGYVAYQSGFIRKWLSVLLAVAGLGYLSAPPIIVSYIFASTYPFGRCIGVGSPRGIPWSGSRLLGKYLIHSFGKLLIPGYSLTVSAVTFLGEFLLIFWLLGLGLRGSNTPKGLERHPQK